MGGVVMAAGWQQRLAEDSHGRREAAINHAADTARHAWAVPW